MNNNEQPTEKKNRVQLMTRTAIILALTMVSQYMGRLPLGQYSNFIVGPLVNACLIIAAASVGLWGAAVISVIAPLFAAVINVTPAAPFVLAFSPFIAVGNFIFVLAYYLLHKKGRALSFVGIGGGAVIKFLVLYSGVRFMLGIKDKLGLAALNDKIVANLTMMFSWPQLATAIAGGLIGMTVIAALKKNHKM